MKQPKSPATCPLCHGCGRVWRWKSKQRKHVAEPCPASCKPKQS